MVREKRTYFPWEELTRWYISEGKHDLPWRDYQDLPEKQWNLLYRIYLSEILLQQTQVDRVIPYLGRILERFPTIGELAGADYDAFFPYYQWMGYYSRARNILSTAKIVDELYNWIFPSDLSILEKLPWVWPYTRSAIQAFGYGIPVLAWDTNLEKVFSRYYKGRKDARLDDGEKKVIEVDFRKYVEWSMNKKEAVRNINNALMDFSRLVDNKNPRLIDWERYPITSGKFFETKWSLEPIIEKRVQRFPTADAHIVVIIHESHRIYYSSTDEKYAPYILVWVWEVDTRAYVQRYFREKYSIELSVRPIHKKWMGEDDIPYACVNAQIQTWRLSTKIYKKEEITEHLALYKK